MRQMKYAKTIRALTVAALAACLALPVMAAPVGPHEDKTATTHHQVVVSGGKVIKYTARAGLLPLYINDTGELMGDIFFVSYSADRPAGSPPRPLIFLWNGGPRLQCRPSPRHGLRPQAAHDGGDLS
jgi:carboxypeptidase C (cathepsin A)